MATKQKRISRFNFKKVFASLFILVILLITSVIIITDSVKAEYTDEDTGIISYIAWLSLYDNDGNLIVNWTNLNDDTVPNVNSQDIGVGYWSAGIYVDENESSYLSSPDEAIRFYLTFTNLTDDRSWYALGNYNMDSYVSSYTDYGYYDIVNLKTPSWAEQMTYDWWRLDTALEVNASLYINLGEEIEHDNIEDNDGLTWYARSDTSSLITCRENYTALSSRIGGVYYTWDPGHFRIGRTYVFVPNYFLNSSAEFIRLGWVPWNPSGDSSSMQIVIWDNYVNETSWHQEYWNMTDPNWADAPNEIIYPADLNTDWNTIIERDDYGDYILVMFVIGADYEGLGVSDFTNYAYMTDLQIFYVDSASGTYTLSTTFTGSILNHEQYSMDGRSIVWLLIGLLPALILGYYIGRPGVIVGLAIMALVNGYSQPNYFWVMALTLGVCAIMLYKGGVK